VSSSPDRRCRGGRPLRSRVARRAGGRVELDSNRVENLIRPQALTRKNSLFAGHDEGAANWARIASLIATCKMNGVEPFAYLKTILERLAAGHPHSRLDDLLPWRFESAAGGVAG